MSPRVMRAFSRVHALAYRLSGGVVGGRTSEGYPVLLLTTRGRRSGRERTTPLVFIRDGERLVLCGGSGGTSTHPGWVHNLRADRSVMVRIGRRRLCYRAREAEGEERERLWREMATQVPRIDEYQSRLRRRVPLVVLEPSS